MPKLAKGQPRLMSLHTLATMRSYVQTEKTAVITYE